MNPHYPGVAQRAGHRCEYCRGPETIFNFRFEVEHIIPTCRQGIDEDDNRALACRSCNVFKGVATSGFDEESQAEARLFHPRLDSWDEHFVLDPESGAVRGKTAVGRATIQRLQLNSVVQQSARRQWMAMGVYP